jgi:hypothetical protein
MLTNGIEREHKTPKIVLKHADLSQKNDILAGIRLQDSIILGGHRLGFVGKISESHGVRIPRS